MRLSKMHGLGNSFVLVDHRTPFLKDPATMARAVCDLHFGLGADGLILLENSAALDLRMRIFNADGSEPEMCGNGVRCFSRFALESGVSASKKLRIETLAGEIDTEILPDGRVRVDMGTPALASRDISFDRAPVAAGGVRVARIEGADYHFMSMGNPHAVRFVENHEFDYHGEGKRVENERAVFPNRTNVEFIRVDGRGELTMRVWERGCGETLACGTGACASVAVAMKTGRCDTGKVVVHLLGGDLEIEWDGAGHLFMTGPAVTVLRGEWTA
jgi:diaminopimelate epimerase